MNSGVRQQLEATQIEGSIANLVLPTSFIVVFKKNEISPSVQNVEKAKCVNDIATNIVNFLAGQDGQSLSVLGDGFTTLVHGAKIKTNTAADKLLAINKVYRFTLFDSVWIEDA